MMRAVMENIKRSCPTGSYSEEGCFEIGDWDVEEAHREQIEIQDNENGETKLKKSKETFNPFFFFLKGG